MVVGSFISKWFSSDPAGWKAPAEKAEEAEVAPPAPAVEKVAEEPAVVAEVPAPAAQEAAVEPAAVAEEAKCALPAAEGEKPAGVPAEKEKGDGRGRCKRWGRGALSRAMSRTPPTTSNYASRLKTELLKNRPYRRLEHGPELTVLQREHKCNVLEHYAVVALTGKRQRNTLQFVAEARDQTARKRRLVSPTDLETTVRAVTEFVVDTRVLPLLRKYEALLEKYSVVLEESRMHKEAEPEKRRKRLRAPGSCRKIVKAADRALHEQHCNGLTRSRSPSA